MNDELKKEKLFQDGMRLFREKDYFEAHEAWEDLWSDYYLEDRKFIQALIQLAVSFVHLNNGNLKGAKSLLNKSKEKFKLFSGVHRGIDLKILMITIERVSQSYNNLDDIRAFDWNIVPNLE